MLEKGINVIVKNTILLKKNLKLGINKNDKFPDYKNNPKTFQKL